MPRAIVIGAGSIGALKPAEFDSPETENVLTHAHAWHAHPDVDFAAIIDADEARAREAGERWGTGYGTSLGEIWESLGGADIVSICSPTETHLPVFEDLCRLSPLPRLVILEKPATTCFEDAWKLADLARRKRIPVIVNYTRRFEPIHALVRTAVMREEFGEVQTARLLYTRGLYRDGCHGLDLLHWFFGPLNGAQYLYEIQELPGDPTVAALLEFRRVPRVYLTPVLGKAFGVFELEIITRGARIVFSENGALVQTNRSVPDGVYGSYQALKARGTWVRTELTSCLSAMAESAVRYLSGAGMPLTSPITNAIRVHQTIRDIMLSRSQVCRISQ